MMNKVTSLFSVGSGLMSKLPTCNLSVFARVIMASIFWKSAMTKLAFNSEGLTEFSLSQIWNVITLNWTVADGTYLLFEYEYDLPVIPFEFAAHLATAAEIILPIALIVGFLTRYAALALLGMTLVIQVFVYPALWQTHGLWAIALLIIIIYGGGRLSLDRYISKNTL